MRNIPPKSLVTAPTLKELAAKAWADEQESEKVARKHQFLNERMPWALKVILNIPAFRDLADHDVIFHALDPYGELKNDPFFFEVQGVQFWFDDDGRKVFLATCCPICGDFSARYRPIRELAEIGRQLEMLSKGEHEWSPYCYSCSTALEKEGQGPGDQVLALLTKIVQIVDDSKKAQ